MTTNKHENTSKSEHYNSVGYCCTQTQHKETQTQEVKPCNVTTHENSRGFNICEFLNSQRTLE